jgi:HEAT repeat protein
MWLGRDGGSGARDALRELAWTCDPALTGEVAAALRALGDRDTLAAAVTLLRAGLTAERCRAARVLEQFADHATIPALCEALADRDESIRGAALDALARVGRDGAAARAAAGAVRDPCDEVRLRAVRAIGRLSAHPAQAVRAAIEDPSPVVRREAGRLAARLTVDDVARLLADHDNEVRWSTAANAGRGAEALLISALESDAHPSVRLAAAHTLGLLVDSETIKALVTAMLEDPDAMVRARALRVVGHHLSDRELATRLREELDAPSGRRRQLALRTLAKLSVRLTPTEASAVAHDPDPDVRLALAQLVSRLVDPPDYALAILLHDDDPTVRHAAMLYQQTY